nr:hypothetical protein [Candidatus Sigynarchaeota archaeon]
MTVVKITRKDDLNALVSKLTLRLGMKPTQQEIVDTCIALGIEHFDELVSKFVSFPVIDDEKVRKIKEAGEALMDTAWKTVNREAFSNQDDFDIYSK